MQNSASRSPNSPQNAAAGSALSRRRFLRDAAGALATVAVAGTGAFALPRYIPAKALGRDGHTAPSNRIVMAGIGCNP
ncbi:MAG: hypothetical protein LBR07_04785, partial [Puniceicoccales bacterium]|nr:hypothetical protein [Puniceicoccales bacterium]